MGAFNTVHVEYPCSSCHEVIELKIQFKYAEIWQYDYRLGDKLKWGNKRHDTGKQGTRKVVLDGFGEECPRCGADGDYYVFVVDDVLSSVEPCSGIYTFGVVQGQETFLVLDD